MTGRVMIVRTLAWGVPGVLLLAALCVSMAPVRADDGPAASEESQQSIRDARQAFGSGRNFPWYDAAQEDLRPVVFRRPWKPWRLPRFRLDWLVWGLVAVLLVASIYFLLRIAWMAGFKRTPRPKTQPAGVLEPERIEALPFMGERPRGDLLGEARRHYQLGNYSEAIIYLFSYELVELDKNALIQLAGGKTNRQYLRETSRVQPLRTLLELTVTTFEGVFFGGRQLDRSGFEACWEQLPEFENLVMRAAL